MAGQRGGDDDATRPPNIVIVLTDQQRWDTLGAHGNPLDLTPTLDAMAAEGTHFASTVTPQPVCAPARASLQTGMYATTAGVHHNGLALDPAIDTIADHLGRAGYRTGYVGKWHLAGDEHRGAVPEHLRGGYQHWMAANLLEFVSDAYDTRLYDEHGREHRLPGYRADAVTDAAIRFVADAAESAQPFLMVLSLLEPHHQNHTDSYPAPVGGERPDDARWRPPDLDALGGTTPQHLTGYLGMVRRVDAAIGRLLDALRSTRVHDDTVVLVTSDHGNHFKTRNVEYKRSCHESSVRVPMVATGPGFTGGGRVTALTSLVDVAPTVLDVAGVDVPPTVQGRSLLPLVRDPATAWRDGVLIQISEDHTGRALRTDRWKYAVAAPDVPGDRAGAATYVETHLYDLANDPYELRNLVALAPYREVASHCRSQLVEAIRTVEQRDCTIRPHPTSAPHGQLTGPTDFPYVADPEEPA